MSNEALKLNADHITSRRTNTSGRALLGISAATLFSLCFDWKLSGLWGLSKDAEISQNDLLISGSVIIFLLMVIHLFNWYSDYIKYGVYLFPTINHSIAHHLRNSVSDDHRNENETHKIYSSVGSNSIVTGGPELKKYGGRDIDEVDVRRKELEGIRRSYRLQLYGLHLALPILVGFFAFSGLLFEIYAGESFAEAFCSFG